ncbi:LysR family transcriptional regulator [Peribacillus sp. TH16]|uniref:LysR family transcriptional regulator n=1 Tax=unclassified Peribacillus TaxID=2675266 RepID=UPI001911CC86|nr:MULTISPECIES: LysR family transcriptional regulator [unclassified Peribacillus]MBK5482798.1 LysR family transcriptional regulator [Peribacillus sp. TH16]WMX58761.1 LysR family transcriptional regulator [Peribacillus sp. R9-11]
MELKNIEAFLMVVEKGSFSAAADALYISQPTISVRIQQLEKELNSTLFERVNGKKTTLTHSGKKVYPYFHEVLHLIEKSQNIVKEEPLHHQKIKISCTDHMGVEIMPEILKILYDCFPSLEFPIEIRSTEQLAEDISAGKIDIGFAYHHTKENHPDLSVIKIANEQNILVCAPDHSLTKLDKIVPSDLENERIIVYNREFVTTKIIGEFLEKNRLKDYKEVEINNVGWLKMMVRKGLGVAFLQEIIVKEEIKNGKLYKVPLSKSLPPTPIYLFLHSELPQNIKKAIIQTSKGIFSQL